MRSRNMVTYFSILALGLGITSNAAAQTLNTTNVPDDWGHVVVAAGDYNLDGFADFVVGSPLRAGSAGGVDIVLNPGAGIAAPATIMDTLPGIVPGDGMGWAIATGEFSGDGIPDIVISAPWMATGSGSQGVVAAFDGLTLQASGSLAASLMWFRVAPAGATTYGFSLAVADFDGDTLSDVVIGAPGSDFIEVISGIAPAGAPLATIPGAPGTNFGWDVDASGDLNADGIPDIGVGAPQGGTGLGMVFGFDGSSFAAITFALGAATGAIPEQFGFTVAVLPQPAGTVPSGLLLAGAPFAFGGNGRVAAIDPTTGLPAFAVGSAFPGSQLGFSMSVVGDRNADGFADFGVGSPTTAFGGLAQVLSGGGAAPGGILVFAPAPAGSLNFGWSVSGSGATINGVANAMMVGAPDTAGIDFIGLR